MFIGEDLTRLPAAEELQIAAKVAQVWPVVHASMDGHVPLCIGVVLVGLSYLETKVKA